MERQTIKKALLSVTDKTGLEPLARLLVAQGVELLSTGGTAQALRQFGLPVTSLETVTGNPEAFGGRMKSISFQVASGLLFRRGHAEDEMTAKKLSIPQIDLVVCNLYQFEKVAGTNCTEAQLVEEIDIGGPLMIRAAAKNYQGVTILTAPSDYAWFMAEFENGKGTTTLNIRQQLAALAFDRIAAYDVAIANELSGRFLKPEQRSQQFLTLGKAEELRYGENPHQKAQWFHFENLQGSGPGRAQVLQGKELSYNNLLDADAAWKVLSDVQDLGKSGVSAVVIKHGNPCGVAHAPVGIKALEMAWMGDSVSAFGGIIALSCEVTAEIANFFQERFIEILMAPSFADDAIEILAKKKNVRVMKLAIRNPLTKETVVRSFAGGLLVQNEDVVLKPFSDWQMPTQMKMPIEKARLAEFAVICGKHLKSNGIALVAGNNQSMTLVGAGMGQPNRLDSLALLAAHRARQSGWKMEEVILSSDAFFPFADSIEAAHREGIRYVVQPGGSIRDNEVIEKCNELGMAMCITGERHFRH